MSDSWPSLLAARGAVRDGSGLTSFGDPAGELAATAGGSIVADLSHLGVLDVTGADARAFLHSQLSCDVNGLGPDASTFGAYCSPKGRMVASLLLWAHDGGFGLALARALVPDLERRLRKFVLRSKAAIADRTAARPLLGVAGPAAVEAIAAVTGVPAPAPRRVTHRDSVVTIGLARERFVLAVHVDEVQRVWDALARTLRPVGTTCWAWLDIRDGIPLVTAATQEAFVPQMANLELIGGVSFQKGCYPGQEVVARTQYLGKAKRRMFLARIETDSAPAPGDDLFSEDLGTQASGTIVNAAPSPEGGFDALAVVPATSAAQSVVHLRALDGPRLDFRPLPYAVP